MAAAVATSTMTPADPAVAAADAIEASFARLCWQRIEIEASPGAGGGRGRAVVMGTRHRRPVTCAVPLEVAAVLRRRGLRTVVRTLGDRTLADRTLGDRALGDRALGDRTPEQH